MSDSGKSINTTPASPASAPKSGAAALPKTQLSLWGAVVTLIGAGGLFCAYLSEPVFLGSLKYIIETPDHVLRFFEAALLLAASVFLFKIRTSGQSIKLPMLLWGVSTLYGLPSAVSLFLQMQSQNDLFGAYFFLLLKALPLLASLAAILYAFKIIKKRHALILLGLLLCTVLGAGIYICTDNLFSLFARYSVFDISYIRTGLLVLYDLFFPVGVFMTALASKTKTAL